MHVTVQGMKAACLEMSNDKHVWKSCYKEENQWLHLDSLKPAAMFMTYKIETILILYSSASHGISLIQLKNKKKSTSSTAEIWKWQKLHGGVHIHVQIRHAYSDKLNASIWAT